LIAYSPALQHDPNRPEDVLKVNADEDGNGGDDMADCLRYLVATRTRTVAQRKLSGLCFAINPQLLRAAMIRLTVCAT